MLSVCCFSQSQSQFSLSGKTKDIPDGTQLILINSLTEKPIDSVKVKDNSFLLQTKLSISPMDAVLYKKGSSGKLIWLENNKMTFDATETSFGDAIITGSKTDSLVAKLRKESRALKSYEEMVVHEMQFIQDHPNDLVSAHNLSIMAPVFGKAKSTELFSKMSQENKESVYGEKISSLLLSLNDLKKMEIGEKFRDFSMMNQNDVEKKISDFKGKVVLLEFWASWCFPCRLENPNLVTTYNTFKDKGFEIVGISLDQKKEDWVKAIQKDGLNWEHLSDLNGRNNKAALLYNITGIPQNVLIDRNGIVIGLNLQGENLRKKLTEIMEIANVEVTREAGLTKVRIPSTMIWKDENGKVLSQSESKKMIESRDYFPSIDTSKNVIILKKK